MTCSVQTSNAWGFLAAFRADCGIAAYNSLITQHGHNWPVKHCRKNKQVQSAMPLFKY